ncbi:MAG TPA: aminotransferase class I/II-fold pyridoxal phosphate-dependent enzyme [Candidatus Rubrimentiphilum sp.]|nr:aminotransferase class I/II-fold pyridoxal phosphate-dependent enzyme [Candidatus Rubrimentiphilum sp.]
MERIRGEHRYREIGSDDQTPVADFSTNDYLGLATDSRMVEALRQAKRVGSGGSRLLGGRHRELRLLEEDLARWVGRERALLFSSGYLAALGAVQVLSSLTDVIYSDSLNHASLIDGIRASGLPREIYPHGDLPREDARRGPALIVTESYFGMDGDEIDVAAALRSLRDDDVLLIDEAHALGVFGTGGAGLARNLDDGRVLVLGTLSKALGAAGGFVAGPAKVIDLLVNTARTFIFDTALPPPIAFTARVGVMLARNADDARARLFVKADRLRNGLRAIGLNVPASRGPIVPVIFGSEELALEAMARCAERGIRAPAIRPPTVPAGTSRLRLSVRADHTDAQIDLLIDSLACAVTS